MREECGDRQDVHFFRVLRAVAAHSSLVIQSTLLPIVILSEGLATDAIKRSSGEDSYPKLVSLF